MALGSVTGDEIRAAFSIGLTNDSHHDNHNQVSLERSNMHELAWQLVGNKKPPAGIYLYR